MKRDMKELEDQAAASVRSAQDEKEHSLQLEKDLKVLSAQLEQVKKESADAKRIAQKAHNDLKLSLTPAAKALGLCANIYLVSLYLLLTPLHFSELLLD